MAADLNDIQIKITLRDEGVRSGAKDVLALSNAFGKVEKDIKSLIAMQGKGRVSQNAFNVGLKQQVQNLIDLGWSAKNAEKKVKELVAQQRKLASQRAAKKEADEVHRLNMRYKEGYAALNTYKNSLRDLIRAKQKGIITTEQYRREVEKLKDAYNQAGGAARVYGQGAIRSSNAMGVAIQQTGYQVGDFFVQVQSGTNAMVAFGQQATQLVGVIPLIHRQLGLTAMAAIGLSTGLGIVIPIVTAIGAAFFRSSGQSKTLQQGVDGVTQSFDALGKSLEILEDDELNQKFGNVTDAVISLNEAMKDLEGQAALKNLSLSLEKLEGLASAGFLKQMGEGATNIARFINPFGDGEGPFGIKTVSEVNREQFEKLGFDMSRDTYLGYLEGLKTLIASGDVEGVARQLTELVTDATSDPTGVSLSGIETLRMIQTLATSSAQAIAEMNGSAQQAREEAEEAKELSKYNPWDDRLKAAQDYFDALEENLGVDAELIKLNMEEAEAAAKQQKALDEMNWDAKLALAQAYFDVVEAETKRSGEQIKKDQEQQAKDAAKAIQDAFDQTIFRATLRFDSAYNTELINKDIIEGALADIEASVANWERNQDKGSGRSGGSRRVDPLERLKERISLQERSLNMSKSELIVMRALGEQFYDTNSGIVDGLVERLDALDKLKEEQRQIQGIFDKAQSSMEDNFMSMIDGTKSVGDAFKSMAADIISDLYRVFVIQRLVGSWTVGANGAAGSGTGIMGIIGGALGCEGGGYTGNGPRSGGVDGKGGFPAILHPRETVVDHTKSKNSGGPVQVTQVFQINGNGDSYILEQIRKAAPAIKADTIKSVIKQRERGGVMKRAFG